MVRDRGVVETYHWFAFGQKGCFTQLCQVTMETSLHLCTPKFYTVKDNGGSILSGAEDLQELGTGVGAREASWQKQPLALLLLCCLCLSPAVKSTSNNEEQSTQLWDTTGSQIRTVVEKALAVFLKL